MKFRRVRKDTLYGRKVNTVYKTWKGTPQEMRKLRKPKLLLEPQDECCSGYVQDQPKQQQRYLVMGKKQGDNLVTTFILPWSRNKVRNNIRKINYCFLLGGRGNRFQHHLHLSMPFDRSRLD